MPTMGRAAVMTAAGADLEIREYPIPRPAAGAILVRITCCTVCRSDLLSWSGRRPSPTPVILGHEIVGRIEEWARGLPTMRAIALSGWGTGSAGPSWTVAASATTAGSKGSR